MWVRFTEDFDFKPKPAVTIAYKAGMVMNVTRACADKAIAIGSAEKAKAPGRSGANESDDQSRRTD